MTRGSRRAALPAAVLSIVAILGLAGVASGGEGHWAASRGHAADVISPQATSTPDDGSGIEFTAYRSYGYPLVSGAPFFLQVRVTVPAGPVHLVEVIDGAEVHLGSPPYQPGGSVNGVLSRDATLAMPGASAGVHTYVAIFEAVDTLPEMRRTLVVDFQPASTSVTISTPTNPVETHHAVTLYAELSGEPTGMARTGTVDWRNADTAALISTRSADDPSLFLGTSLSVGTRRYVATYSGDGQHAAATSPVFTLTVVADTVQATGVGVASTSIYPVKDGYRDTVAIKGVRAEPISVSIRIYSPTGSMVRSASFSRGTGSYSYAWNGRTSSGSILPRGRYKVVQTLTDAYSTKRTWTSYVSLSHKKLVTHTSYVTKLGSSLTAKGVGGTGRITVSTTSGYVRLSAGSGGWAIAGWEFYLPAATVYKSVTFQVYAKAVLGAPPTSIGLQSFTLCPRVSGTWYDTCFGRWASIGNSTNALAWYSTSTTSSSYRSGRYVRGLVDVSSGTVYVYKARAKVVYQTLE